jgi:hypothetical protein
MGGIEPPSGRRCWTLTSTTTHATTTPHHLSLLRIESGWPDSGSWLFFVELDNILLIEDAQRKIRGRGYNKVIHISEGSLVTIRGSLRGLESCVGWG